MGIEKFKRPLLVAGVDVPPEGGFGGGAVDSVNGQTGAVTLSAADVGALPDSYVPPAAPVTSVNGATGAVTLSAADVDAPTNATLNARFSAAQRAAVNALTAASTLEDVIAALQA